MRILRAFRACVPAAVLAVWVVGRPAVAQGQEADGRIFGRVRSVEDGTPLAGARVHVRGADRQTLTDENGRFVFDGVRPGAHELVVELLGYRTRGVTAVVEEGRAQVVELALVPDAIALDSITVTAAVEGGSTAALVAERLRSSGIVDAVGAEQIARSPDGDAAAALARVPGVTVMDGKYAYVRGLGDRYNTTVLNGVRLASPVPDKKVIPLDVIPSALLESVVTAKTYSADRPGDYAGGLIELRTRQVPSFSVVRAGVSAAYRSGTSLRTGLGYAGGRYDFLGFDDGSRALPPAVPADRPLLPGLTVSEGEAAQIGRAFAGPWGPRPQQVPLDRSFVLSLGDELSLGGRPLGVLASLTLSNSFASTAGLVERVFASAGAAEPEVDYRGEATTQSAALGSLVNLSLRAGAQHRLALTSVYNRLADDEARVLEGFNLDSNTDQRNTRIRYVAQSLMSAQLTGEHRVAALGGTDVNWRAAYTRASRYEPNTREVLYRRGPDGRFFFDTFVQSGSIFYQDLADKGFSGGLDLRLPFALRGRPTSVAVGVSADRRDRSAYTRRFRFLPASALDDSVRALAPDLLFAPEHMGPHGFQIQEATFREDNYRAQETIDAGYVTLDAELLPGLRVAGGARLERTAQRVQPRDLFASPLPPLPPAELEVTDLLPALNVTYELSQGMNLRAGVSRTLARPQLRELAPFAFADYAGGFLVVGNPELERARIRNYDVRWEWTPGPARVLAAGAFYKRFQAPIETLVFPSSELIKTWVNTKGARNYGIELELRTSLDVLARAFARLALNANLTLVTSEVTTGERARVYIPRTGPTDLAIVDVDRPLQGQSPYVVNVGLGYEEPRLGTQLTLLYNRFGRRIDAVGTQSLEPVYEEARGQLDVVVEQALPARLRLKLAASRLLGSKVEFTQGGDVVRAYNLGRTFSLSLSWSGGER